MSAARQDHVGRCGLRLLPRTAKTWFNRLCEFGLGTRNFQSGRRVVYLFVRDSLQRSESADS